MGSQLLRNFGKIDLAVVRAGNFTWNTCEYLRKAWKLSGEYILSTEKDLSEVCGRPVILPPADENGRIDVGRIGRVTTICVVDF